MAGTYEPIATTTLSSPSGAVGFSSIPSTYTDLIVVASIKMNSGTPNINLYINTIDSQSYSSTLLKGTGSATTSSRNINKYGSGGGAPIGEATTEWGIATLHFNNYSNTTTYKTILTRITEPTNATMASVCLVRSTAAISSFVVQADSGSFVTDSTFTIYGIKAG
jgi:hypothetical protein